MIELVSAGTLILGNIPNIYNGEQEFRPAQDFALTIHIFRYCIKRCLVGEDNT